MMKRDMLTLVSQIAVRISATSKTNN